MKHKIIQEKQCEKARYKKVWENNTEFNIEKLVLSRRS